MAATQPIVPKCRYDHGALIRADSKGEVQQWGLVAPQNHFVSNNLRGFLVALYVCPTCGYCEMFDPEPQTTVEQNRR